ncbi:MAG: metal ABC transporter substrate-binding protein, partial [Planctomycetales bacterium]
MRSHGSRLLVAWLFASALGCESDVARDKTEAKQNGDGRLVVFSVNYPLRYFADRLGGDLVTVELPAAPDVDPAHWRPDAATIGEFQRADLILLNGAGYARWVESATLPPSKTVDTTHAVQDRFIAIKDTVVHAHGPSGEHSHGDVAFTTWLDPVIAVAQAQAARDALRDRLPQHAAAINDRFESLKIELLDLDRRLQETFQAQPDRPLLASHPVYQYFAARYGLNLQSVHWEPGEYPDEKSWA